MDNFDDAQNSMVAKPNTKDLQLMNENNPEEVQVNPFSFKPD